MPNWIDGVIVSLIALGVTVLVGILGYLVDKSEGKSEGDRSDQEKIDDVNTSEPADHNVEAKRA
jgi:hypothetical protein